MRSATCLQTLHILLSFALKAARKALFLCVINSSTSRKPKYLLHSITMSIELALKIFIRTLVTVNSSDLTYVRFTGHAMSAYNKQGKHLSSSKCRTVSSAADLPMFPNIVLKLRKRTFLRGQNNNWNIWNIWDKHRRIVYYPPMQGRSFQTFCSRVELGWSKSLPCHNDMTTKTATVLYR